MIHVFDECLAKRASDSLGRMLDFSVHSLRLDTSSVLDIFVASGTAADIENSNIRLICGMSGTELAYELMDRSGLSYERTAPRHTRSLSSEYWCAYTLAQIHWMSSVSFSRLLQVFSVQEFTAEYSKERLSFLDALPLDISSQERTDRIRSFGYDFALRYASEFTDSLRLQNSPPSDTPLKIMRTKNGLSQSALARASGVPLRTIQQYEQRRKDLSKARAEYLIRLSSALNCSPASLLE